MGEEKITITYKTLHETITDDLLEKAERHDKRALMWEGLGKPEYAARSREKAQKFRDKRAEIFPNSVMIDAMAKSISDDLEEMVIRSIYGK